MNKVVIWDLDGVLADTAEAHFRAWVSALAQWEIPLDRSTFERLFGMNNRDVLTELLGRPPAPGELGAIAGRKEYLFRLEAQRIAHPMPGALRLLTDLEGDGWSQAIASSAPQANVDLLVDKFGIRERFQVILSGDAVSAGAVLTAGQGRPDPALFLRAADRLDVPPSRCVVVQDAPAGVEAARRASMACIAVATTRPRAALEASDLVFDDLTQPTPHTFSLLIDRSSPQKDRTLQT